MSENHNPIQVELNETARLEAFSDGVFAIAITLLILEIRPPLELHEGTHLWDVVLSQWTLFAAYLAGFSTIGIMWINHHRLFTLIRRADNWLLVFNLMLLLGVTFINYPTALLGKYLGTADATTAMAIYTATTIFIAIGYNVLWRHAERKKLLYVKDVDPGVVKAINRGYLFGPLFYSVAFVFAFINVYISLFIVIALALFFALPQRNLFTRGSD